MAISKIPAAGYENPKTNRNIVINGDMRIAQRATSATTFDGTYQTVDRYTFDENLGTGTATSEQVTESSGGAYENGFTKAVKISCTTADASPSNDERAYMQQSIEGQFLQSLQYGTSQAKTITLSFWAQSNMTGNFPVTIKKDDNTIHYIVHSFNITSADTWQKFTFTITPTQGSTNLITQSAAKINDDNGRGMQIFWGLYWGSNYTGSYSGTPTWTNTSNDFADSDVTYNNFFSSTDNYLKITGVQLEVGSSASDFEFVPHDVSLQKCRRYYLPLNKADATQYIANAFLYSSTHLKVHIEPTTDFRATPSISQSNSSNWMIFYANGTNMNLSSTFILDGTSSTRFISLYMTSGVSGTAGHAGGLYGNSTGEFALEAEL